MGLPRLVTPTPRANVGGREMKRVAEKGIRNRMKIKESRKPLALTAGKA